MANAHAVCNDIRTYRCGRRIRAMARWDEVTLYGQLAEAPLAYRAQQTEDGELLRVIAKLTVLRGIRKFGAYDQRQKLDVLSMMSGVEKDMKEMLKWDQGDMVLVRGQLITQNHAKHCRCEYCGHVQAYPGYTAYINPIFVYKIKSGYDPEKGLIDLRRWKEVSNRITAVGTATADPSIHLHETSGTWISSYKLKIDRKVRVREDAEENHCDFPVVKSYGDNAVMDHDLIRAGSLVLLDGMLQSRTYDRQFTCEACGATFRAKDYVVEIVPYSTEYLKDCGDVKDYDVEKAKARLLDQVQQMAEDDIFGNAPES